MSFSESIKAIFSALRSLVTNRRTLMMLLATYAALIGVLYQFVSTREATVFQLLWTLILVLLAPLFFFALQALSVNLASDAAAGSFVRTTLADSLKLGVVTLPLVVVTVAALYGLNKIETPGTTITAIRYLLISLIVPLFAIQLWVASTATGLRSLFSRLKPIAIKTLAPNSMFVYACGFLIFAVAPYFLLTKRISSERAWLEFSLLVLRLSASALLILIGWVTTVGALSILSRKSYVASIKE